MSPDELFGSTAQNVPLNLDHRDLELEPGGMPIQ